MEHNQTQSISTIKANEAAVLGSMILDNATISKILLLLRDESFLFLEHRLIFKAIRKLWFEQSRTAARGIRPERIDGLVLRNKLAQMGFLDNDSVLDQNGGVLYLQQIMNSVPSAANSQFYAGKVRESEKEREIEHKLSELSDIANSQLDPDEKIQSMQETILNLDPISKSKAFHIFADEVDHAVLKLLSTEELIKTGFFAIDQIIAGFVPSDFIILGARPSMGKTSLALNIAYNVADLGKSVLVFSLETPAEPLIYRILCSQARVDCNKVKLNDPSTDEERIKLYEFAHKSKRNRLSLVIVDSADTPADIQMLIRQHREVADLSLVIVDYIQLLSTGHRQQDLRHTVTEISKQLKRITRIEGVPILALSQLSRNPVDRTDFRPRMSDLRESGALEQDADTIMLLHREDYYHRGDREWLDSNIDKLNLAEVIIDKNRNGPCGVAELVFCPPWCLFTDKSFIDDDDIPPSDKRDDNATLYNRPTPEPSGGKGNDAA